MGKLGRLGLEPAQRYERARPGALIQIYVRSSAVSAFRGAGHRVTGHRASQFRGGPKRVGATGWEYVHIAIDDCTRPGYAEVVSDERATTVVVTGARSSAHLL